ncbi:MAG: biopolymer transporter ExbD [Bdellovibrionales bacterium]|nr:biopolymer transporter ExbD [Bdellovibrionales bacterium]
MPIYKPGKRSHRGHVTSSKRSAVAVLQLTAMVDMFTVLVVFLLQNYATTNQILPLSDSVALPMASTVKELKPSSVVLVSKDGVRINNTPVLSFQDLKNSTDWLLPSLKDKVEVVIRDGESKKKSLGNQIREAMVEANRSGVKSKEVDDFRKITIEADKEIDFLSIKKVMYTVTEAGIYEINFAVLKKK